MAGSIKILDLFSGVGGFMDAAHLAGDALRVHVEHVLMADNDPSCMAVLAEKYPSVPLHGDVTSLDTKGMDYDLICFGAPCQAFSRNGRGYNHNNRTIRKEDQRANLFLEAVRMMKENKPKAFVFENVKEILTIKAPDGERFLNVLLDTFDEAGYAVTYKIVCPTDFGIPQQRKRVFFVGIRKDLVEKHSEMYVHPRPTGETGKVLDYMEKDRVDARYYLEYLWRNRKMAKDKNAKRLDVLKAAYQSGEWQTEYTAPTGRITPVAIIYGDTPSGGPRQQDKLYSAWGISPTIATFSTPAFDHPTGWRTLTPKECFRLQSFPENHPIPANNAIAYKQAGNAVNVRVVTEVLKGLFKMKIFQE